MHIQPEKWSLRYEITEDKHRMNVTKKDSPASVYLVKAEKSECCWFQVHLNIVSRIRKFTVWKIRHFYIVAYSPYQP